MKADVYNIIWADDDIVSLSKDSDYNRILKQEGVQIIDIARTSSELKERLEEWGDMVDAIITDGNYDKKKLSGFDERDTSGLTETITLIHDINKKRFVPAFLYTGKGKILKEKFSDGELDFFEKKGRYFEKGQFPKLVKKLKEDVNHLNSSEFRIRNKYDKEFEAAKEIDGARDNLLRGLLYLYEENSWKDVQDYFNPARKIVERIMTSCADMNILPPHLSLNIASKIFSGIKCGFSINKELMEKPLAESLFFFLKITQDGSHDSDSIPLNVDKYVRETKNINLYRSVLYIAMDLLLWHKRMKDLYKNNTERLWDSSFIYMGEVSLKGSCYYTGKYQLDNKDGELKEGDWVGIWKSDPKRYSNDEINEFVYKKNYVIIEYSKNNNFSVQKDCTNN